MVRTILRQGRAPQDFARRVEVILERVDRETEAAAIVNALPDMALCPRFREPERPMVAALTRRHNQRVRHVADGSGIDLVDLGISDHPKHQQQRFFSDDDYHPSDTGYAAWASALWAAVRQQIPEPAPARAWLAARPT